MRSTCGNNTRARTCKCCTPCRAKRLCGNPRGRTIGIGQRRAAIRRALRNLHRAIAIASIRTVANADTFRVVPSGVVDEQEHAGIPEDRAIRGNDLEVRRQRAVHVVDDRAFNRRHRGHIEAAGVACAAVEDLNRRNGSAAYASHQDVVVIVAPRDVDHIANLVARTTSEDGVNRRNHSASGGEAEGRASAEGGKRQRPTGHPIEVNSGPRDLLNGLNVGVGRNAGGSVCEGLSYRIAGSAGDVGGSIKRDVVPRATVGGDGRNINPRRWATRRRLRKRLWRKAQNAAAKAPAAASFLKIILTSLNRNSNSAVIANAINRSRWRGNVHTTPSSGDVHSNTRHGGPTSEV